MPSSKKKSKKSSSSSSPSKSSSSKKASASASAPAPILVSDTEDDEQPPQTFQDDDDDDNPQPPDISNRPRRRHFGKAFLSTKFNGNATASTTQKTANVLQQVRDETKKMDPPGISAYEANNNNNYDASKEKRIELGVDAYSIILLHGLGTTESFWSFTILIVQMSFVILFYWDLLQGSTPDNIFDLPTHQTVHMQYSQLLALFVIPYYLGDVTAALVWLGMRYEPIPEFPSATAQRWYWTLFLRIMVGSALIFVSFLLIMQSTSLTELFLNLQTILFVGTIDDLFVWLAHYGFLQKELEKATRTVQKIGWTRQKIETRKAIRGVFMVLLWLMLVLGWLLISLSYTSGIYLLEDSCKTFTIQMEDLVIGSNVTFSDLNYMTPTTIVPANDGTTPLIVTSSTPNVAPDMVLRYTYFSGTYRIGLLDPASQDGNFDRLFNSRFETVFPEIINDRLVYYQDYYQERDLSQLPTSYEQFPYQGKFSFCASSSSSSSATTNDNDGRAGDTKFGWWIFTVENIQPNRQEDDDECPGWLMRSPFTESVYTLQNVTNEGWDIWTGQVLLETSSDFQLDCDDCTSTVDCGFEGTCSKDEDQSTTTTTTRNNNNNNNDNNNTQATNIYPYCNCNDDRLGHNCEVGMDCRTVEVTIPRDNDDDDDDDNGRLLGSYARITKTGTTQTDTTVADDLLTIAGRPVFIDFGDFSNLNDAVNANATLGGLVYAATRWYQGSINAQVLNDLVEIYNPELHPIWNEFVLFNDIRYASNPTRRGSPTASQLNWYPVEIVTNTTGLPIDYIVQDDEPPVGDIVNCRNSRNVVSRPYFDAPILCDPSFLRFELTMPACPMDLTDLPGRAFGYHVESGNILANVAVLFDNNANTMASYSLRSIADDGSSGTTSTYVFEYTLVANNPSLQFSGCSIKLGPTTDLTLVTKIQVAHCRSSQFIFNIDSCAIPLAIETDITSRVVNVEFPRDVRVHSTFPNDKLSFLIEMRQQQNNNNNNDAGSLLEIEELQLFGFLV